MNIQSEQETQKRAILMANLEKARQKRREQAELTRQTKEAEKALARKRAEARLVELKKEEEALEQAHASASKKTEVVSKAKQRSRKPPAPKKKKKKEESSDDDSESSYVSRVPPWPEVVSTSCFHAAVRGSTPIARIGSFDELPERSGRS